MSVVGRLVCGVDDAVALSSIAVAEADALVRAGVPKPDAYRIYQTCARFTLAEIAADTSDPEERSAARREMFIDGVELLLDRIRRRTEGQRNI